MNERTNVKAERISDDHRCKLYLVNAIVCDLADFNGKYPSVEDVKGNWRFSYSRLNEVSDTEIEQIIRAVERCDMGLWN